MDSEDAWLIFSVPKHRWKRLVDLHLCSDLGHSRRRWSADPGRRRPGHSDPSARDARQKGHCLKGRWDENGFTFVYRLSWKKMVFTTELMWESSLKPKFKTDTWSRGTQIHFRWVTGATQTGPVTSVVWASKGTSSLWCRRTRRGDVEEPFLLGGTEQHDAERMFPHDGAL